MPETAAPSTDDLLTQLVTGPSITEVASTALRPALKALYPELDIDPAVTMVVTPTWRISGEKVTPDSRWFEPLTDVLVRLALSGTTETYIDGEHFLTLQPSVESALQLPVKIDAIGALLNELAPLLFTAYQEQQVDYWNETTDSSQPRWHQLSDTLRNLWNTGLPQGWDKDQRAMAQVVFNTPDKVQRLPADPYQTRACLIDLDRGNKGHHLNILDTAVLIGTLGNRTLILTYSLIEGYKSFDSLDDLAAALLSPPDTPDPGAASHWRLFEPEGNFFDHQACTLIALEADAIGAINFFQRPSLTAFRAHDAVGANEQTSTERTSQFTRMEHQLPEWLDTALPADQSCYSRHLLDLAQVQRRSKGKTFQGEIPSIKAFALDALGAQLRKDHPEASELKLDDVEISITSVVAWGTFILPGNTETLTLTLSELALQNLAGLPLGNCTVRYKDGTDVPAWMTPDYLKTLVTTVNIGAIYPAMLQRKLIDDTVQAAHLQALYSRQLAIELPLMALQYKIRGKAGMDQQGYRYVVAALATEPGKRRVDGQEIVIRPLAFITGNHANDAPDEAGNMFVIGPRDPEKGPCLLYRPLLEPPLLQYPSRTNLLYAIKHSRALRQSVLAWLPDDVRFNYSQYVFPGSLPSVWTVPQLLVDPSIAINMTKPVVFGERVIEADRLVTLFQTNTRALITQADRQSVSNAEARWATLKRGGWMLFNAALPFLGRGAGTAAWIWQIMDDLQAVADSQEQAQDLDWSAVADIFLTLGMVLAHRAATREKPVTPPIEQTETARSSPEEKPSTPIAMIRLPDIASAELPEPHETSLYAIGALNRSRPELGKLLDSLKINEPDGLTEPLTTGPHQHLRALGEKWYARVGDRWFEVMLNDNEDVQIVDNRQSSPRAGPLLRSNSSGEWFVDLRLRLRGGGLRNRRKQLQRQNQEQLRKQKEEIAAFDAGLGGKRMQLFNARRAMLDASPETADSARKQFLDTLDSQAKEYCVHIENLKALNILESVPNYRTAMLDRLSLQLFLMQSWLDERYPVFRTRLVTTLDLLDKKDPVPRENRSVVFKEMSDLTEGIIDKIEFAQSRFKELSLLGKEAVEVSRQYKAKLPPFELQDLKLLQIILGQELCLKTGPQEALEDMRLSLDKLLEDAALNIQSAHDLAADESLHNLGERIEATNNLVEQFSIIDQRFLDFSTEFPEHLDTERLEQTRKRVAQFHTDTVQQLSNLLRDQRLVEPVPGPSRPSATPTRKIIKTRFKGTLVGLPRKNASGQESDLVDVIAPLTGKVIATFHEKTPGVWVERVTTNAPTPVRTSPNLSSSLQGAQTLLDELPAFIQRTESHTRRAPRIPKEIEEIYRQHASRLRDAMEKIDKALSASNVTEGPASATTLRNQLESAATDLYAKGRSTRIELTKQQPPTAARVEWLKSKDEVTIPKATERRRLKGPRKDYLLEYEILDKKTNTVLWYAHFHYANPTDPLESFTAGHLKTIDQRRLGGAYDWRDPHSNQELIAIYRSEINRTLATALFFT